MKAMRSIKQEDVAWRMEAEEAKLRGHVSRPLDKTIHHSCCVKRHI